MYNEVNVQYENGTSKFNSKANKIFSIKTRINFKIQITFKMSSNWNVFLPNSVYFKPYFQSYTKQVNLTIDYTCNYRDFIKQPNNCDYKFKDDSITIAVRYDEVSIKKSTKSIYLIISEFQYTLKQITDDQYLFESVAQSLLQEVGKRINKR